MRTIHLNVALTEPQDMPEVPWAETLESMLRLLFMDTTVTVRVDEAWGCVEGYTKVSA